MERDGYYIVTGICLAIGLIILLGFIIPTSRKLQGKPLLLFQPSFLDHDPGLPISVWRIRT